MLKRRFFVKTIKLLRVYSQAMVSTYHKAKTVANAFIAAVTKSESNLVNSVGVDSTPYEASLSNIDVFATTSPSLDADGYEAKLPNVDAKVMAASDIDSESYDVSVAISENEYCTLKLTDGVSFGAALGDSKKEITNEIIVNAQDCDAVVGVSKKNISLESVAKAVYADSVKMDIKRVQDITGKTDALSGDSQMVDIDVVTTTGITASATACEKVYSQLDVYAGVAPEITADNVDTMTTDCWQEIISDVFIDADLTLASMVLPITSTTCASVDMISECYDSVAANSNSHGSIIVSFAPIAKADNWLDPILTDGVLFIRQAYGINKNNNILEVI